MLLTDEYPPFSLEDDPSYPVRLEIDYPEHVDRWRPLVHWLLILPYAIVAAILVYVAGIVAFIGVFVILFTKKLPRGDVQADPDPLRWQLRGGAYAPVHDHQYPPFEWERALGAYSPSTLITSRFGGGRRTRRRRSPARGRGRACPRSPGRSPGGGRAGSSGGRRRCPRRRGGGGSRRGRVRAGGRRRWRARCQDGGASLSSHSSASAWIPGSSSLIQTPAVMCIAETSAMPSAIPDSSTAAWTSSVMRTNSRRSAVSKVR